VLAAMARKHVGLGLRGNPAHYAGGGSALGVLSCPTQQSKERAARWWL